MTFSSQTAHEILARHFGYQEFRNGQEEIIQSVTEGRDTLVVMPTGGGKSLCYQVPAMLREGVALVISPLIALMKDQVDSLKRARIQSTFINSTLSFPEIQQRLLNAKYGQYKLIYVAPERLESKQFLNALKDVPLSFMAVDEAHCVSEWGHDFRPAYLTIPIALQTLGRLPVVALTATATPEVQDDIMYHLGMKEPQKFTRGFDRPNLRYMTELTEKKAIRLVDHCKTSSGTNIVYCGSRKRVEQFTQALQKYRVNAEMYHAGMPDELRRSVQERFLNGAINTLVATSAFGMGIDKPDVRTVVHCDLTLSLEAYYQEAGRAGRDGRSSDCIMLHHPNDQKLQEFFVQTTHPNKDVISNIYSVLYDANETELGLRSDAPVLLDETQIANRAGVPMPYVTNVLAMFERQGIVRRGSTQGLATLQFTTSRDRLIEYFHNTTSPERKQALEALLRSVGSMALDDKVQIDLNDIVRKHDIPYDTLMDAMRAFQYARLVYFEPPGASGGLTLLMERMPVDHLPIDFEKVDERRERAFKKLDVVQRYAMTTDCKRNFILHYFKEFDVRQNCGQCSSCASPDVKDVKRSSRYKYLLQQILGAAVELDGRFGRNALAEVLSGKDTAKIRSFGLRGASVFESAKEFSFKEIVDEIDAAISERFLKLSSDIYPVVSITEKGLKELQTTLEPLKIKRTQRSVNTELLSKLLAVREELANRENVSPRAIIDDVTLSALLEVMPKTAADVQKIPGVGMMFLTRFAEPFLRVLHESQAEETEEKPDKKELSSGVLKTLEFIKQGWTIEKISEARGVTPGTIAQHIQEALESGLALKRSQFISDDLYGLVFTFLKKQANAPLREIRASIGSQYDYPQLRVAACFARKELRKQKEKKFSF
jgi:ATP-dependent DNA helicase RecQ